MSTTDSSQVVNKDDRLMKFSGWKEKAAHGHGRFFGSTRKGVSIDGSETYLACMLNRDLCDEGHYGRTVVKHVWCDNACDAANRAYGWYRSASGGENADLPRPTRVIEYAVVPNFLLQGARNAPSAVVDAVGNVVAVPAIASVMPVEEKRSALSGVLDAARRFWSLIANALRPFTIGFLWASPKGRVG